MGGNVNHRLKKFLLAILRKERSNEAWDYLKTLDLKCNDLNEVMAYPLFAGEAWQLFKEKNGTQEDFLTTITIVECPHIRTEVEVILMDKFSLDNKGLEILVEYNDSDAAAKLLLDQNPSNEQLELIMQYSNFSNQAAEILLTRSPDNYELHNIIKYSNLKQEAWELLLRQSPTNTEVIDIIHDTDFYATAWDYLCTKNPKNYELKDLIYYDLQSNIKEKVVELILSNDPSFDDLISLIREELSVDEAWDVLTPKRPNKKELKYIVRNLIRRGSVKEKEAVEWCLGFELEKEELLAIVTHTNRKDEAAIRLAQLSLDLQDLSDIVVHTSIEPILSQLSEKVQFDRSQVDESELIQIIAQKLIDNPELLNVKHWHEEGTHCLGGWAITLVEEAQKIEQVYSSEIAACLLLPNYTHLFVADKQVVLDGLRHLDIPS